MEKFNNLILNDDGHHIKLIIEKNILLKCLQFLLRGLLVFLSGGRLEGEIFVLLTEGVGVLQGLGQLGPHRLGQEGGGEAAGEADEEEDEVGQPQVGGAERHGVGTSNTDHL